MSRFSWSRRYAPAVPHPATTPSSATGAAVASGVPPPIGRVPTSAAPQRSMRRHGAARRQVWMPPSQRCDCRMRSTRTPCPRSFGTALRRHPRASSLDSAEARVLQVPLCAWGVPEAARSSICWTWRARRPWSPIRTRIASSSPRPRRTTTPSKRSSSNSTSFRSKS